MLTATYSLIAISNEQKNTYQMLTGLTRSIQSVSWQYKEHLDRKCVNAMLRKLLDFNQFCRRRKVETLMIPAVRRSSPETSTLLSELDNLNQQALKNIHCLYRQTGLISETEEMSVDALLMQMLEYCQHLMLRFEKEDIELYPLARRLLSNDEWFNIAVASMQNEIKPQSRFGSVKPSASQDADEQLSLQSEWYSFIIGY
jgi:hemerythrin-like domain-containing protein